MRYLSCHCFQVSVQAELYGNALSLQRRVMDELLGHLFSAYNTFLSDRLNGKSLLRLRRSHLQAGDDSLVSQILCIGHI